MRNRTQELKIVEGDLIKSFAIKPADEFIYKNIKWGRFDELFTPAYWKAQFLMNDLCPHYSIYQLGKTLEEEIVACILGGYGISADIGLKAYSMLYESGLISSRRLNDKNLYNDIYAILSTPISIGNKKIKYRFAKQKSSYLCDALSKVWNTEPPNDDLAFRQWLLSIKGIGPKTASWITRNWRNSDNVAIIDIHIFRAGILMGLFSGSENISKQYWTLEKELLSIATAMQVHISKLDAIIWHHMRILNHHVIKTIHQKTAFT